MSHSRWNRRQCLEIAAAGAVGCGAMTWQTAQAATSESRSEPRNPLKACILLYQYGGPSHLDMFDMKPHAPAEVRGEFTSIETSVPGLKRNELPQH